MVDLGTEKVLPNACLLRKVASSIEPIHNINKTRRISLTLDAGSRAVELHSSSGSGSKQPMDASTWKTARPDKTNSDLLTPMAPLRRERVLKKGTQSAASEVVFVGCGY